jgi:RHS repeat-associated protein
VGQRYQYDAANRLVKVKADNNVTVIASYTYGDDNQRLIADEGGVRTYYAATGGSVLAEYTESGTSTTPVWSKSYVYLGTRLLSTLAPNGTGGETIQYHHSDRLGTRLVTDPVAGTSFEQVTLPFGTELDAESTGATNRRFTSYDRSDTTGLDYAVNRHYDPQQGRFTQVDPIGMGAASIADPQSFNHYAYTANDPVNFVDPTGLKPVICGHTPEGEPIYCEPGHPIIINHREKGPSLSEYRWVLNSRFGGFFGDPRGGGGPQNTGEEFAHARQPCPPTASALRNNPIVQRQLRTAFAQSGHRTPHPIEQGGWIYQTSRGGLVFRRASADRLSEGEIDLRNPPFVRGAILVADFHAHPYTEGVANATLSEGGYTGPSGRDDRLNYEGGIPGLVISETGPGSLTIWSDGPNRRGSDPDRAKPPAFGYPGNSVDTRARCP